MLYFAYGSNLHHFQMKRRCKDSVFLKKINLKDFRLTFRSKYRAADIEPKKNSIVPGGLFEISKSDEKKLDEGWQRPTSPPPSRMQVNLMLGTPFSSTKMTYSHAK